MEEEVFDLAVVGAGPGGSAAVAAALAGGLSVVQVERATLPRVKPCAGGLTVKSLRALPPGVERTFRSTFGDVEFAFLGKTGRRFGFRGRFLAMVDRPELDAALVDEHRGHANFRLLDGEALLGVAWDGEEFVLETPARTLRARQLVGADGANGVVSRTFGGQGPRARAVALEVDVPLGRGWRVRPESPCFDFGAVPRGYGWVFPKGDHATVGIYSLARPLAEPRRCLREYLLEKGYAPGATAELEFLAHLLPVGGRFPLRTDLPVYPVGDAGGFADALLGEGIYHALESGRLAGETAVRVAREGAHPAAYRRALLRRVLPDTWVTWATASLVYALPRLAIWLVLRAGVGRIFVHGYGRGATFAECCLRAPAYLLASFLGRTVKPEPPQDLMGDPGESLPPATPSREAAHGRGPRRRRDPRGRAAAPTCTRIPMKLTSKSFAEGERIPSDFAFAKAHPETRFTFAGNRSPHLAWEGVPAGTRSFALICVDPDAPTVGDDVNQEGRSVSEDLPRTDFHHWAMADLPSHLCELAAGACGAGVVPKGKEDPPGPAGSRQGQNDYTGWFAGDPDLGGTYHGYDGPAPPWNDERIHRYRFTLFALDVERLEVPAGFGVPDLRSAIEGHVLAEASLTGTYTQNPDLL